MPDHIPNKGASLCIISAYFFEKLSEKYPTHYVGVLEHGKVKRLDEHQPALNTMEAKLVRVLKPRIKNGKPDYSIFRTERSNFLKPLEIMYRNSLPEGSSIFQRRICLFWLEFVEPKMLQSAFGFISDFGPVVDESCN